jgi:hypothetical protein
MIEVLKYMTSGFWVFCGTWLILLLLIGSTIKLYLVTILAVSGIKQHKQTIKDLKKEIDLLEGKE